MTYRKMTQEKMTSGYIDEGVYKASEDIEVYRIGKRKKDKGKGYHPCILRCVVPKGSLIVKPESSYFDNSKMRTNALVVKSISKVETRKSKDFFGGYTSKAKVSPSVRYKECISPVYSGTFKVGNTVTPEHKLSLDFSISCDSGVYFFNEKEACLEYLVYLLGKAEWIFKDS